MTPAGDVVTGGGITLAACATTDLAAAVGGTVNASRTVVAAGAVALVGFTMAESTGSGAAKVRIRDGNGGTVLRVITLAQSESRADWFGELPLAVTSGVIYLEIISGTVEGSVHWA